MPNKLLDARRIRYLLIKPACFAPASMPPFDVFLCGKIGALNMQITKTKIVVAVVAFTLAFTLGVWLMKSYPRLVSQSVSLCTVTKHRSLYRNLRGSNIVNLKGNLYGGKILSFGDANLKGCEGSMAEVVLADEGKLSFESQDLIRELRLKTNDDQIARAEVELIGTLEERRWHCFSAKYVVTAVQITPTGSLEVIDASTLASEMQEAR